MQLKASYFDKEAKLPSVMLMVFEKYVVEVMKEVEVLGQLKIFLIYRKPYWKIQFKNLNKHSIFSGSEGSTT